MHDFYPVLGWNLAPSWEGRNSSQYQHWVKLVSQTVFSKQYLGCFPKRIPVSNLVFSGPISCDIAILSLRYPILRDTFLGREISTPQKWCDTHPWHLVSRRHICAIPHFATYRAIIVRHPTKISAKEFFSFAMLSLQASRDMKSMSAGPLTSRGDFVDD